MPFWGETQAKLYSIGGRSSRVMGNFVILGRVHCKATFVVLHG